MKRPWSDATSKTHDCYTRKAGEIIAEVLNAVASQSDPELWEAVRRKDEFSQLFESVGPGSDLLLAVVESYKQANTSEIRRQLPSLVAGKVTYAALAAHIPRMTRYEFTAARRYMIKVGAGLPVQPAAKQTREKVYSAKLDHFLDIIMSANIVQDLPFGRKTLTLSSGMSPKSSKSRRRFNSKQNRYLEGKFQHGESTGVRQIQMTSRRR